MKSNSGLEEEICVLPVRAWRKKLRLNSSLEEEITSGIQEETEIPQEEIEIVEEEITYSPGRNHLGPGKKSLGA